MTPTYIKIANMIANNHIGTTVLFLYPIPNLRKLKSLLYIIDGLNAFIIPNNIIKIKIETILRASLDIKLLNIVIC
jgi:hypothetical protein